MTLGPPRFLRAALAAASLSASAGVSAGAGKAPDSPDPQPRIAGLLVRDNFEHGLGLWKAELEKGGKVEARDGRLEIDVPGGCTVWLKRLLQGPLMIEYEATAVSAGGPNDRVSDLNCFWMARDVRSPADIFAPPRTGAFADYDLLRCYYVGLGGNGNTTTRFRRYVGERGNRPILPGHDLSDPASLLTPNVAQEVRLVAAGRAIAYYRDGRRLFALEDPAPYTSGWFAIRTTQNHMIVRRLRVFALAPEAPAVPAN